MITRPVAIILLSLLSARVVGDGLEFVSFSSYRFSSGLEDMETEEGLDLHTGTDWGFVVSHPASALTRYELRYSHQNSGLTDATDPDNAFDLEVHYLHFGGTMDFSQKPFTPFFSGGFGLTHMTPSDDTVNDATYLSLSLGGGMKWYPTSRLGIRFEVRGYGAITESEGNVFCDGDCNLHANGDLLPQFETNLGVILKF